MTKDKSDSAAIGGVRPSVREETCLADVDESITISPTDMTSTTTLVNEISGAREDYPNSFDTVQFTIGDIERNISILDEDSWCTNYAFDRS